MGCTVCASTQRTFLYRWTGGMPVYRCATCDLLYTDPLPDATELADFYRTFSLRAGQTYGHMRQWSHAERHVSLIRDAVTHYFNIVKEIVGGDRVVSFLDVGGGTGLYAKAAQISGYESHFVDIDSRAVTFAKDQLQLDHVTQADIQTVGQYVDRQFDMVLARHTIEHLRDPAEFVRNLASVVKLGKVLIIETPSADNWEQWGHPRIFGFYWSILRKENPDLPMLSRLVKTLTKPLSAATPPKHLYGFNKTNLARLLERYQLQTRRWIVTTCGDAIFDPLYYLATASHRSLISRAYASYEQLVTPIIRAFGKGSRLILFAQRMVSKGTAHER